VIPAGTSSDEVICLVDLTATAAAITGSPLPEDAAGDSYNILPALRGDESDAPIREATVHHSSKGGFAIRQGRWVLLDHSGSGGNKYKAETAAVQLYDLEADPGEVDNLFERHPEISGQLKALLETYKSSGRSRPR
jgi:arylsulfatase A-like enzyme